jgi:hypothetical protein
MLWNRNCSGATGEFRTPLVRPLPGSLRRRCSAAGCAGRVRGRAPHFVGICPLLVAGSLHFFVRLFWGCRPEKLRAAPGERGVATTALSHLRTCNASVLGFYWLACFALCRVTSWLSSHLPREMLPL